MLLLNPNVRQRIADQGNGNSSTRAADTRCLRAFQKAEIEKWRPIIEAANAAAWWGFH
jgi:hypothetical protein